MYVAWNILNSLFTYFLNDATQKMYVYKEVITGISKTLKFWGLKKDII